MEQHLFSLTAEGDKHGKMSLELLDLLKENMQHKMVKNLVETSKETAFAQGARDYFVWLDRELQYPGKKYAI